MIPYEHTLGMDMIPAVRHAQWGTRSCEWASHFWIRFISIAVGDGETLLVLCRECGRTPLEALASIDVG